MVIRWEVRGNVGREGNGCVFGGILLEFCYKDCGIFVLWEWDGIGKIAGLVE